MAEIAPTTANARSSPPSVALGVQGAELIAPAGNFECAKAAAENGADAVYFGLDRHNARLRADNFTEADLPRLMEFLHLRGMRGYVCLNTLIFAEELAGAEAFLRVAIRSGVDAAIVQDVGVCRLIRRLSPDFPIHASTQMSVTSARGVRFARGLGCNQVVLARECSVKEIGRIQREFDADSASGGGLPLEVFIHGALCVAYSGQCLTSEALGGRSANRGECAQACRMPFDLIADGRPVPLGDRRYLLSPQDLAGLPMLPELLRVGVRSFKIEGRLKTPEYVANITRIYRKELDRLISALASETPGTATANGPKAELERHRYDLEMAFSRGLYTGWLGGVNNQELVHGRFGKKRGVYLGRITRLQGARVFAELESFLKPGDGVVFDAGRPDLPEEGGRVYEVQRVNRAGKLRSQASQNDRAKADKEEFILGFGRGDIDCSKLRVGDRIWKTSDPELEKRWRQSYQGDQPKFQRPVTIEVGGCAGEGMRLTVSDELGHRVELVAQVPLAIATRQPLTPNTLREQLGRLGGTPFRLGRLVNCLAGEVILPLSELNRLRRQAVIELEKQRSQPPSWQLDPGPALPHESWRPRPAGEKGASTDAVPELIVLVRNQAQLEAALGCDVSTVYCDFEDPRKYRDAVQFVRDAHHSGRARSAIWVAPPRIFKPGEGWILDQVRSCNPDGYLVRNYDQLEFFADQPRRGDYSLNVANPLAAQYFIDQFGLDRVTASYDLNISQLGNLLQAAPPSWFEITIHQHMPMFHMEHCVFCAFLSQGTDYTNCGRPCEKHAVKLRDRVGAEHPVKADAGCRNTVYNALAQTGAESVAFLMRLGARKFRVEFVDESPDSVRGTIVKYRRLLEGEIDGKELWQDLRLFNQLGVTRGQLHNP